MLVCKSMFTYRFIQHTKVSISVSGSWFTMATNGSADLRSPEKEVCFRSWDLANSQMCEVRGADFATSFCSLAKWRI